MANSTKPGPAEHHGNHRPHRHQKPSAKVPDKPILPAKTPGPAGKNDQSDPLHTAWLGVTSAVTGARDWADHSLHELEDWWHHTMGGPVGPKAPGAPPVAPGSAGLAPVKGPLTLALLKKLFPQAKDAALQQVADEINVDPKKFELDTPLRRAHFFAQVMEEGGPGLEAKHEKLFYRASVLKTTFSYYIAHPAEADVDGSTYDAAGVKMLTKAHPETIANKIYGNRLGNGPPSSGEGWKYCGRGLIQVTGKENYQKVATQYQKLYADKVDFVSDPDKMGLFPYDVRSAISFWVMNHLGSVADKGATDAVVDKVIDIVNSKTKTRSERKANFKVANDVLK